MNLRWQIIMLYHLTPGAPSKLATPFAPESIAILRSAKLGFAATQNATVVNVETDAGDILLHISLRPKENVVVFNTRVAGGNWAAEERIPLADRFKNANPSITIYNHGDRFQVLFDYVTVKYFNKRIDKVGTVIAYNADEASGLAFSKVVTLDVHASFAELV
jgi:Galactoside-binding lectin